MGSYLRNHVELQDDPGEPAVYIPTQDDWAEWSDWCARTHPWPPTDAELAELDALGARTAGVIQ